MEFKTCLLLTHFPWQNHSQLYMRIAGNYRSTTSLPVSNLGFLFHQSCERKFRNKKPGYNYTTCSSMTYWHGIPSGADEQKHPWWMVIHYGDVTVANNCRICRRKKEEKIDILILTLNTSLTANILLWSWHISALWCHLDTEHLGDGLYLQDQAYPGIVWVILNYAYSFYENRTQRSPIATAYACLCTHRSVGPHFPTWDKWALKHLSHLLQFWHCIAKGFLVWCQLVLSTD